MPSISALILGLVQGLTEFLPVSSSGHLVLAAELLDYQSPGLIMETVVHVATTVAVIIYFRSRFASVIKGVFNDAPNRRLALMLLLAFAVTSVIGLALSSVIAAAFESPLFTGAMLLITAVALVSVRWIRPGPNPQSLLDISWKTALIVGLAQGLAIFPGISRSGFTIIAGLWAGQDRNSAAEFSFLLAVPTLSAASLFSIAQEWSQGSVISSADSMDILVAGIVAFITGLLAIHWLMRWLQRGRLWWFSGYCAVVGGLSVVLWGFNLV